MIHISKAAIITINKIPIETPIDPATEDFIVTITALAVLSASRRWTKKKGDSSEDLKCIKASIITATTLRALLLRCSYL